MRNGALEELENHRAGPSKSSARTVGSTTQPAKTTRCKFTEEDDQILLKWVHDKHEEGLSTSGNEIYKQLESMVGHNNAPTILVIQ